MCCVVLCTIKMVCILEVTVVVVIIKSRTKLYIPYYKMNVVSFRAKPMKMVLFCITYSS